jgi:hypothetical protein
LPKGNTSLEKGLFIKKSGENRLNDALATIQLKGKVLIPARKGIINLKPYNESKKHFPFHIFLSQFRLGTIFYSASILFPL